MIFLDHTGQRDIPSLVKSARLVLLLKLFKLNFNSELFYIFVLDLMLVNFIFHNLEFDTIAKGVG